MALLFGSDQFERGHAARASTTRRSWSGRTGGPPAVYRKMHLVPFGEYVPLKRLLFFVAPLVESVSDFSPGEAHVVMPLGADRLSARPSATRSCTRTSCAAFVAARQPAADDDHQRRLVRPTRRRRTSTSSRRRCGRSSRDATSRAPPTPASAASSIRTAACVVRTPHLRADGGRRRRALPRRAGRSTPARATRSRTPARLATLLAWWRDPAATSSRRR